MPPKKACVLSGFWALPLRNSGFRVGADLSNSRASVLPPNSKPLHSYTLNPQTLLAPDKGNVGTWAFMRVPTLVPDKGAIAHLQHHEPEPDSLLRADTKVLWDVY